MDSALLSSRNGYPLEPKSGLNGVKPPVEFGERTRDCSLGHGGESAGAPREEEGTQEGRDRGELFRGKFKRTECFPSTCEDK